MRDVERVGACPLPPPLRGAWGLSLPHDKWSTDLTQILATYPFRDRLWLG